METGVPDLRRLRKFSSPITHWRSNNGLAQNLENFRPSTPLWRWEMRFDELLQNFFPHSFPLERNWGFERRSAKLFFLLHHCGIENHFFNEIHIFI
jgi:hypothetical protein